MISMDVVPEVEELARRVGSTLKVDAAIDLPNITADFTMLIRAITNLTENALRHNPSGTVVRISLRREGTMVRIEVEDDGKGIAVEDLSRIFERFYQVRSEEDAASGTGLGLAIVKKVLEAQGTDIHVESTLGKGTRFWFLLPQS
jgi:two-component system phosphate regulon sensor histidine kinase PhoR